MPVELNDASRELSAVQQVVQQQGMNIALLNAEQAKLVALVQALRTENERLEKELDEAKKSAPKPKTPGKRAD